MAKGKQAASAAPKENNNKALRQIRHEANQLKKKTHGVFGKLRAHMEARGQKLTKTEFRRMVKQGRAIAHTRDPFFGRPVSLSQAIAYATR